MATCLLSKTRFLVFVAFLLSLKLVQVHGQTSSSTPAATTTATSSSAAQPTTPATNATVFPGTSKWEYIGCWNETTLINGTGGARALAGEIQATEDMTVNKCLDYCSGKGFPRAGLEYTSECYCADHVNALSNKLDESECNLACKGNDTQVCGGKLTLTVYESKKETKGSGSTIAREAPVGSILALGIAMGTLLCMA